MIPTRSKDRLPRHLSYPVGAEAISEALAEAPHAGAFTVAFRSEPVWPASKFRHLLLERLPYPIMAAEYLPARKPGLGASNDMVKGGRYNGTWELRVYPVLAESRHLANQLLQREGLPAIVAWLKSSDRAGWLATSRRSELVFSPADGTLACREASGA